MIDPSLPLQKAQYDALMAAAGVPPRVYDDIPKGPGGKITAEFPFVQLGEVQVVSDADQCHDPCTAWTTTHVWSRAVGKVEAKTIMAACLLALDAALSVQGFLTIGHFVEDVRHLTDPDGVTSHSVATTRYRLSPAA